LRGSLISADESFLLSLGAVVRETMRGRLREIEEGNVESK